MLSHCSDLDYFNDVFNNFSGPADVNYLAAYGGVRQLSDFIKNILMCCEDERKSYGLWNNMRVSTKRQHFHFWVNYPFNSF